MQEAFKFYKNKTKTPDLKDVIDCTEKDNDQVSQDASRTKEISSTSESFP